MQHERAPRSIRGRRSLASANSRLERSKEKRKSSTSFKVKCEVEQLSSEPNSPYSSSISPEHWNDLESSADTGVFPNRGSSFRKDYGKVHLSINDDTNNTEKKFGSRDFQRNVDAKEANPQYLPPGKSTSSDYVPTSNGGAEAQSNSDNFKKISTEDDVVRTDMNSSQEASFVAANNANTNNSYHKSTVTDGLFTEKSVHFEQCTSPSFSLYDSSIQLLYMSVSWARGIPMFLDLPFRDQAILLEEAWCELFLLNAVHYYLPVDTTTLLPTSDHSSSRLCKEIRTLQNVLARFHQLQINNVEYACLKAVVLFKSGMLYSN